MITKVFTVVAIHGEGDRNTVNSLRSHRNATDAKYYRERNIPYPEHLLAEVDEPPDVILVLRDETHQNRIEWEVKTWEEVEKWKSLAGYDYNKRHWMHGSKVKVTIGV